MKNYKIFKISTLYNTSVTIVAENFISCIEIFNQYRSEHLVEDIKSIEFIDDCIIK